jgi:hypothetical protein
VPATAGSRPAGCRRVRMVGAAPPFFSARAPGIVVQSAAPVNVTLARFSDVPSVPIGTIRPGTPTSLLIPADTYPGPWKVSADAGGAPVMVCRGSG